MKCISQKDLARYLVGEVTRSQAEELEQHLAMCRACGRELEGMREMVGRIAESAGPAEPKDHLPEVRRRIASGDHALLRRRRRWPLVGTAGAVVVALAVAGFFLLRPAGPDESFRTKADHPPIAPGDRWAGIQAFRVGAAGTAVSLGGRLEKSDYLVFSYTNLGERPYDYLMIFAVDQAGRVYWFHPAFLQPGEDPASIQVEKDAAGVELREKIRHAYPAGRLWIYGVFSNRPLNVSSVEKLIGGAARGARIPLEGASQQILVVEVVP